MGPEIWLLTSVSGCPNPWRNYSPDLYPGLSPRGKYLESRAQAEPRSSRQAPSVLTSALLTDVPTPAQGASQNPKILDVQKGRFVQTAGMKPLPPAQVGPRGARSLPGRQRSPAHLRWGSYPTLPLWLPAAHPHLSGAQRIQRGSGPRAYVEFASDSALLSGSLC